MAVELERRSETGGLLVSDEVRISCEVQLVKQGDPIA